MPKTDVTRPRNAGAGLRNRAWVPPTIGTGAVLAGWILIALIFAGTRVIPTPWAVADAIWSSRDVLPANIGVTLKEAAVGFLWGNAAAIILAAIFVQVPMVERLLLRMAIASYCIPLVAIAPILVVVLSGDQPKEALAALSVFFTTLVSTSLGLRSAQGASLDVVTSWGGGSWAQLRFVRIRTALPLLFAGLKIAAPAAVLGAIIGEYMGANAGLGVALIQAQSSFAVPDTWAIALVISAIAGLVYGAMALLARMVAPESHRALSGSAFAGPTVESGRRGLAAAVQGLVFFALSVAAIIALWYAVLQVFSLNGYFAKTPLDVWQYVFTQPDAAQHRAELLANLATTAKDAGVGYLVGTAVAVVLAVAMVTVPHVRQVVLPVAIVFRSVPIVAMTPLIALVFGRGILGVTVVVGLVVFFPTLVNVTVGLASAPAQACDLITAFGGSRWEVLRRVRLLYALPAIFASARIAVPAALGGATLAEWLATGQGLGSLLVVSYSNSQFGTLWSAAVLVVAVSVLVYGAIAGLERGAANRYGG